MSALPQYADPGLRLAARRSPAVVSATDLVRRYGEGDAHVDALRCVSLEIEEGCLTAIMGPSGSGKSTLMPILAGLDKPTGRRHASGPVAALPRSGD
jgi:ABC-type lipoprotein export system ATPase subunit